MLLIIPNWAWLTIGLVLRLIFAFKLGGRLYQIDEGAYDAVAWSLASSGTLGPPGTIMAPLVPSFFAIFYLAGGHHLLLPRLAQACVGTGVAWLVGLMTRDITRSENAGHLALALASIYPFFIYYCGLLMSETLYLACIIPGLWVLCRSLREGGRMAWRPAVAGLLLGASALCRPEAAPIVFLLWMAAVVSCVLRRWAWKAWILAFLCWALPLISWCTHNEITSGRFALDTHGGITLLHGTLLFDYNEIDTSMAMKALEKMPLYQEAEALSPAQRNDFYMRKGLEFMLKHPGQTFCQWGRKLINFWRFYPRMDKIYHETTTSNPGIGLGRMVLVAISLLFEPAIILLGLAGLWRLRQSTELFPLWLFMTGTMGIHMVSVSQMRYRLPIMPFLILGTCDFLANFQSQKR